MIPHIKYKKTVRVLLYPNWTFIKNLEADSQTEVLKKQIKILNEIRDDLFFYILVPKQILSLNFNNVHQEVVGDYFHTYAPTMRNQYSVNVIQKIFDGTLDIDLVYNSLPEHNCQLKSTLYNVTHHIPAFFGYAHFFDLREVVTWPKDNFNQNIIGLLEYDKCYLNTQYQKDMVLKQASETFNSDTIKKLDDILTVQHLGVDKDDITDNINENPEKIIVFNHRPDTYKHFKQFTSLTDKLWEQRKDFKVWVPLLEKSHRDYVIVDKGDKQWYYNKLKNCYMGFSPKQKYGGWSVATTDGMMNCGTPYIMYDDIYYKELYSEGMFFKDDKSALDLMNKLLDDKEYRNIEANKTLNHMRTNLVYRDKVVDMSNYMNDLLDRQKVMGDSDKLKQIIGWIKQYGCMSKLDLLRKLNWGRGIKWTPYRRALMKHPNIFDVNQKYPVYHWRD